MHAFVYTLYIYIYTLLACVYHLRDAILLDVSACLLCESLKKGWLLSFLLCCNMGCRLTSSVEARRFEIWGSFIRNSFQTYCRGQKLSRIPNFIQSKCYKNTCLKHSQPIANTLLHFITSSTMKELRLGLVIFLSSSWGSKRWEFFGRQLSTILVL